jgi:hypothetical protein
MTYLKRLLSILTILILAMAVLPSSVLASSPGTSLTTSPVTLNLDLKPGTQTTKTLSLLNNGNQPLNIKMVLDEFKSNGTTGQPLITQPASNDPTLKWVSFSPSSFVAQPNVWSEVKMTVNLPKDAQLGYYFAVVFSPSIPNTNVGARTNTIKGSNGILVLIDTGSSNEVRNANIANFSISKRVYEYLPVNFKVTIHNSGNIYIAPIGDIYVSRSVDSTNTDAVLNINSNGGNVLPNSNRDFNATWSDGFPVFQTKTIGGQVVDNSKGQPIQQLKWNFSHLDKLRIGKYYAKLTLIYNTGHATIPLTGVVSFWVLPWKIILAMIAVGALVCLGLWSLIRYIIKLVKKMRR